MGQSLDDWLQLLELTFDVVETLPTPVSCPKCGSLLIAPSAAQSGTLTVLYDRSDGAIWACDACLHALVYKITPRMRRHWAPVETDS